MTDRHGGRHPSRRRWFLAAAVAFVLFVVGAGVALAVTRYLPALDDVRNLQADLDRVVQRARSAGLTLDRPTLDAMEEDVATAQGRYSRLRDLAAGDPLVAVARGLPPFHDVVAAADAEIAAAGHVLEAADAGLILAGRYVAVRERQAAAIEEATAARPAGSGDALAGLVELMATGRDETDRMVAAVDRAEAVLATVPAGLPGPLAHVRTRLRDGLAELAPPLRAYAGLDETLPAILGWDGPRRYLVLTQNPAELRPTGGFIGSFGITTFDRGRITEYQFQDVALLDSPLNGYPFVAPPAALAHYLLGPGQPWQLADANWSPNFPTSAQQAARLYLNEGGSRPIDGVLGITTHTIDELLLATGPVTVPGYDVTVASGETTLKTLQNTRVSTDSVTNRKAFLSAFADRLLGTLLALPPARWASLAARGDTFRSSRLVLAWFRDTTAQAGVEKLGLDGAVRGDLGDYVYPVDSNVSPVSKLNAVTDRELELKVELDAYGNAHDDLTVRWTNRIDTDAAGPYRRLPTLEGLHTLGMYFRLYVPEASRVEAVRVGSVTPINTPADVSVESGRLVIANYFRIPPGAARLRYQWISPYAADVGTDGIATYRLTIQAQPGLRPGPVQVRITVPMGASIIDASPGVHVGQDFVALDTVLDRDIVVVLCYRPAPAAQVGDIVGSIQEEVR